MFQISAKADCGTGIGERPDFIILFFRGHQYLRFTDGESSFRNPHFSIAYFWD
jgi:hypothetical protein